MRGLSFLKDEAQVELNTEPLSWKGWKKAL